MLLPIDAVASLFPLAAQFSPILGFHITARSRTDVEGDFLDFRMGFERGQ